MKYLTAKLAISAVIGAGLALSGVVAEAAMKPKHGGTLNFVVGSKIPSYDGHKETTFGMIHPIRPFYSTLIRVNPENPSSPTDFVCDVCEGAVPTGEDGGTNFTFKILTDKTHKIIYRSNVRSALSDEQRNLRVFPTQGESEIIDIVKYPSQRQPLEEFSLNGTTLERNTKFLDPDDMINRTR